MVQHYYGAKALADRLNYSPGYVSYFLRTNPSCPVYKRRNKRGLWVLYSNESMLTAWELVKAATFHASRWGKEKALREQQKAAKTASMLGTSLASDMTQSHK